MSREDDKRELRKLEYLNKRGVATFSDNLQRKELARKMVIEDFEQDEALRTKARELAAQALGNHFRTAQVKKLVLIHGPEIDKKGASN